MKHQADTEKRAKLSLILQRENCRKRRGAVKFSVEPVCVYSVTGKNRVNDTGEETFGLLCYADIEEFSGTLDSEIEKVVLLESFRIIGLIR